MKNLSDDQKAEIAAKMQQVSQSFENLEAKLREATIKTYFTKSDVEKQIKSKENGR